MAAGIRDVDCCWDCGCGCAAAGCWFALGDGGACFCGGAAASGGAAGAGELEAFDFEAISDFEAGSNFEGRSDIKGISKDGLGTGGGSGSFGTSTTCSGETMSTAIGSAVTDPNGWTSAKKSTSIRTDR